MFRKTNVTPFTRTTAPASADSIYWKKFTAPILLKEVNVIDYIDVSPIEPHFIAITCSSRVQLYHPITRMIHKNYNRFKEAAYGATFRHDGRLLIAGSDESSMKLFDVSSKNLLRVFKGHQRSVRRCTFMPADNHIVSFSDDKTVIQWDMPSEALLHKFEGHTDYVRCGTTVVSNPSLIVSGSYDHTVKIWDKRETKEVMSVNHGSPVETVLISSNGSLLFTAGSTEIKVWDCLSGGRLLSKISQHHKTITCLRFATNGKRFISAGLDRHVKIYDMSSFEVIHSLDYSSPILSLGVAPDDKTLIVGMSDGIIAISRKETEVKQDESTVTPESVKPKRKLARTFTDIVHTEYGIKAGESTKDVSYDAYLRKFRYSKALDTVLSSYYVHQNPGVTVAVFQELMRRDGLKTALAGRKGNQLIKVLRFLLKYLRKPMFMRVLLPVANVLVDLYASKVGENLIVDNLFVQLFEEVDKEVKYMTELMEIQGALNMIVASVSAENEPCDIQSKSLTNVVEDRLNPSDNAMKALIVDIKDR